MLCRFAGRCKTASTPPHSRNLSDASATPLLPHAARRLSFLPSSLPSRRRIRYPPLSPFHPGHCQPRAAKNGPPAPQRSSSCSLLLDAKQAEARGAVICRCCRTRAAEYGSPFADATPLPALWMRNSNRGELLLATPFFPIALSVSELLSFVSYSLVLNMKRTVHRYSLQAISHGTFAPSRPRLHPTSPRLHLSQVPTPLMPS